MVAISYPQCGVGKVVGVGVLETGMVSSYDVVAVVTNDGGCFLTQ